MYFALVLSHLGSLFLGVTLALAILFNASSRHEQPGGAEAFLIGLFSFLGLCVAMSCYLGALALPR
ncbi:MAG: hypothetical protein KJZ93_16410 [Caldilineaceae bacterium]|nr:hypothetical protein [Caldilineaceae bacterium]